jgi:hypothetical protein
MSERAEVVINSKGVTTIPYIVFRELEHSAICHALGIRIDSSRKARPRKGARG